MNPDAMKSFLDDLETRPQEVRERALLRALADQIGHARREAPYFKRLLADIGDAPVDSREALARLPVTRKADLHRLQREEPPFGGFAARPLARMARVFSSPGPIYEPQGARADFWGMARALYAAGFRAGDLVYNTFSYHFTPAGFMFDSAAQALGCPVFPAGVGQTELQLEAIAHLRPVAYAGTPSFLRLLLEKGEEAGRDTSSLTKAAVSGEAFLPATREFLAQRGVVAYQSYGTADLGLIAYETPAREGLVVDEGILVEILEPGGTQPVAPGEPGEVVVTTLTAEYPLIRFSTGDLSAELPGPSPCGRTNRRIRGWMGRADQAAKVRGMFVHPFQLSEVLRRYPEVVKARLVIEHDAQGNDRMRLLCETAQGSVGVSDALATTLRDLTKLRGEVEFVPPQSLPADGRLIEDRRSFE